MIPNRSDLVYGSTKTYTHSVGLSCCFRQWRADSHCRFLHGYAIQVRCEFEASELDVRNWAVDFGSMKSFKGWLEDTFDHKLLVAEDDPMLETLQRLDGFCVSGGFLATDARKQVAQIVIVPATGCESMARMIYEYLEGWLVDNGYSPRVTLVGVEVAEHQGNSAFVRRKRHVTLRTADNLRTGTAEGREENSVGRNIRTDNPR